MVPAFFATTQTPESTAAFASIPVPTTGASVIISGTAVTLHVGSHQRTVRIIVLQERNQCSSHREYHSRGYIHVIKHFPGIFLCLIQITSGNRFSHEMSLCIQCFVSLCHMVLILFVRSHVDYFIGNAGVLRIGLVDLAIRSLYKTIFINSLHSLQES